MVKENKLGKLSQVKLRFSEEAYKILKNLPLGLDIYSVTSKPSGKFCGLLRIDYL